MPSGSGGLWNRPNTMAAKTTLCAWNGVYTSAFVAALPLSPPCPMANRATWNPIQFNNFDATSDNVVAKYLMWCDAAMFGGLLPQPSYICDASCGYIFYYLVSHIWRARKYWDSSKRPHIYTRILVYNSPIEKSSTTHGIDIDGYIANKYCGRDFPLTTPHIHQTNDVAPKEATVRYSNSAHTHVICFVSGGRECLFLGDFDYATAHIVPTFRGVEVNLFTFAFACMEQNAQTMLVAQTATSHKSHITCVCRVWVTYTAPTVRWWSLHDNWYK